MNRLWRVSSVVAELSDGAVVQATLMGMALRPGHFLGMHAGSFALISGGMALGHHGLMTALLLLPVAHPFHKQRFRLSTTFSGATHGALRDQ